MSKMHTSGPIEVGMLYTTYDAISGTTCPLPSLYLVHEPLGIVSVTIIDEFWVALNTPGGMLSARAEPAMSQSPRNIIEKRIANAMTTETLYTASFTDIRAHYAESTFSAARWGESTSNTTNNERRAALHHPHRYATAKD